MYIQFFKHAFLKTVSKKIARQLLILALICGICLLNATQHHMQAAANKLRIAVSLPDMSMPFYTNLQKQILDAASQLDNVEITVFDGQGQTGKQSADLEKVGVVNIVDGKYDGLIVSPLNADTMVPAISNVVDAKIPVITIDRDVNAVDTLAHVGVDNLLGGTQQGNLIIQLFPKGANILNIQGTPGASPAIDRNNGLHQALRSKQDYHIILEKTANFRRPDGHEIVKTALETGKTMPDVINCGNDDMAFGALDVLREKGLIGKVAVIGYDALPETLTAIQKGEITATVEQFPGQQARKSLELMVAYLRDGKTPATHDNYLTPVMITKDNLDKAERIGEAQAMMSATAPAANSAPTPAATASATQAK